MPAFSKSQVQRVYLPSTANEPEDQKLWVDIDSNVTAESFVDMDDKITSAQAGLKLLSTAIVDWNNTDEKDAKVEISPASVAKIGLQDFQFLSEYIGKVVNLGGADEAVHANL